MTTPVIFTTFSLLWAVWWGALHTRIRRNRVYGRRRRIMSADATYRWINPALFVMHVGLCTASFWASSPWLLALHHSDAVRALGVLLLCVGSGLYAWALGHLGSNYSPCYDSRAPIHLVRSGPYGRIRHPMYAGKLIVGAATVVLSGSLWLVPATVYLFAATLRATCREDRALKASLPDYWDYQGQTTMLIPWLL